MKALSLMKYHFDGKVYLFSHPQDQLSKLCFMKRRNWSKFKLYSHIPNSKFVPILEKEKKINKREYPT